MLVHGLLGSRRNLSSLARRWSKGDPDRCLVLVDLPGHGGSPPIADGAGLKEVGAELLRLVDHLDLPTPVDLVGHSLGGRVSLAAFADNSAAIATVTLLDISPSPLQKGLGGEELMQQLQQLPPRFPGRRQARDEMALRGIARSFANWMAMNLVRSAGGDCVEWRVDRRAIAEFHLRQLRRDLWPLLGPRSGDGLVCIRGENSDYVSESDRVRLIEMGARVVTIPGAGHFLHVDAPDEVVRALL